MRASSMEELLRLLEDTVSRALASESKRSCLLGTQPVVETTGIEQFCRLIGELDELLAWDRVDSMNPAQRTLQFLWRLFVV